MNKKKISTSLPSINTFLSFCLQSSSLSQLRSHIAGHASEQQGPSGLAVAENTQRVHDEETRSLGRQHEATLAPVAYAAKRRGLRRLARQSDAHPWSAARGDAGSGGLCGEATRAPVAYAAKGGWLRWPAQHAASVITRP
jgi:hypothetical protein